MNRILGGNAPSFCPPSSTRLRLCSNSPFLRLVYDFMVKYRVVPFRGSTQVPVRCGMRQPGNLVGRVWCFGVSRTSVCQLNGQPYRCFLLPLYHSILVPSVRAENRELWRVTGTVQVLLPRDNIQRCKICHILEYRTLSSFSQPILPPSAHPQCSLIPVLETKPKQAVVRKHNKPRPMLRIARFLRIDPKLNHVFPWSLRTFPENFMQIGPAVFL